MKCGPERQRDERRQIVTHTVFPRHHTPGRDERLQRALRSLAKLEEEGKNIEDYQCDRDDWRARARSAIIAYRKHESASGGPEEQRPYRSRPTMETVSHVDSRRPLSGTAIGRGACVVCKLAGWSAPCTRRRHGWTTHRANRHAATTNRSVGCGDHCRPRAFRGRADSDRTGQEQLLAATGRGARPAGGSRSASTAAAGQRPSPRKRSSKRSADGWSTRFRTTCSSRRSVTASMSSISRRSMPSRCPAARCFSTAG